MAQLFKSTPSPPRWCPWDLLRSFKVYSDAKKGVGYGKQWEATAPIQSLVKLQSWFLSLRWKTCLRQNCSIGSCACSEGPAFGQNTLMIIYTGCPKTPTTLSISTEFDRNVRNHLNVTYPNRRIGRVGPVLASTVTRSDTSRLFSMG